MKAIEFQNKVQESFLKYFPCGYCYVGKFALGDGVYFNFGLIEDINDVSNKIRLNDPMKLSINIHDNIKYKDDILELPQLVLEFSSSHISVLPDNPYMYCTNYKLKARKISQTPEKALLALDKYFSNCRESVKQLSDTNQIINQKNITLKYCTITSTFIQ